ncbi:unnamed protein product [Candidula unifasciata]|uniref:Uncharacterized protein n=1 Tax=Candidula unifasciata TaxID=100452 RepID=A0A8S4A389_9EUPU|nr:unnamed protein product [Candidula unifasciata]
MAPKEKKPVEVVVFENPQKRKASRKPYLKQDKRKKFKKTEEEEEENPSKPRAFFDQKKFRYDVRKLGIHGFDKKDKETAMVDFLVELGAKPPKNKCYPIQEYQKIMKEKKDEEKRMEELERKAGIKKKKPRTKKDKSRDDILGHVDGQVGFYKEGVQFVKKHK